MFKKLALFFILLGLSIKLHAQDVEFLVDGPRVTVVDRYFKIEFKLNAEPDSFEGPDFGDMEVVAGPIGSQMSSYSYVNGKSTSSKSFIYTYGIVAHKEGTFTIPAATAYVDGKVYHTNAFPIEVVKERTSGNSGGASSGSAQSGGGQSSGSSSGSSSSRSNSIAQDDIILRMSVDKSTVYKGEPIVATIKIYDRTESIVGAKDVKAPEFNGFWKQEIEFNQNEVKQETFNGKVYRTQTIGKYLLFPQKAGELIIEPMSITFVARIAVESPRASRRSVFDDFFGAGMATQDIECKRASQNFAIKVKELPAGAPAGFDGAVGEFAISCDIKPTEMAANSGGDVVVRLTGTGNMPLINAPKISLPSMFETYPAKTSEKLDVTSYGVKGYKQFEYPFIARAEGEHEVQPLTFAYFDPKAEKYKIASTKPYTLTVTRDVSGSSANVNSAMISGITKEELRILDNDIRYIRSAAQKFKSSKNFLVGSFEYVLALIVMFVAFVGSMVYLRKRIQQMRDEVRVKNKRANKVASKRLKAAYSYMKSSKQGEFYQEMLAGILGYVSDKLNIPVAELSKDNISMQLTMKGIDNDTIDGLLRVIADCEMAQYSPMESSQMSVIYTNAVELIGRVENKI
ncbi:MAG: BatD family protein [Rikenellaceae bacterium]